MRHYGKILMFGAALTSVVGLSAFAAQLDGLEIKPINGKVQVVLDVPGSQAVQVEKATAGKTVILLPQAVLPKAFQGSGLPPITSDDTGVSATVTETGEGLRIELDSPKAHALPYDIRYKTAQKVALKPASSLTASGTPAGAAAPLDILRAPKRKIRSQVSSLPVVSRASVLSPVAATLPSRPAPAPVVQVPAVPAPVDVVTDTLDASSVNSPVPELNDQALLDSESDVVVLEHETPISDLPLEPEVKTVSPDIKQTREETEPVGGIFSGALLKWSLVALAMVGALILMGAVMGIWLKRRLADAARAQSLYEASLETRQPVDPMQPRLTSPAEGWPEVDTFDELDPEHDSQGDEVAPTVVADPLPSQQELATPQSSLPTAASVQAESESVVETPVPQPVSRRLKPRPTLQEEPTFKSYIESAGQTLPLPTVPFHATTPLIDTEPAIPQSEAQPRAKTEGSSPSGSMLFSPTASLSEAVHNSFKTTPSAFVTPPFQPVAKAPYTGGGPKLKASTRQPR